MKIKDEPDSSLMSAYRRLEGIIRKPTGLEGDVIGAKLFTKAFRGENAPLYWGNVEPAEREGRAAMFEGIYMAFRNRRAHRELKLSLDEECIPWAVAYMPRTIPQSICLLLRLLLSTVRNI
jgi:hypothetical protein